VLLVVDDVWSDAAARAFRLTGPQARVLYTTRDPQVLDAVGARAVPVEALSLAAARALAAAVLRGGEQYIELDEGSVMGLPQAADVAIEQVGRVALAVALVAAAVRGGRTWQAVAADLKHDADVFGDHPYSNTFKAMQINVDALPTELTEALYGLAVFPRDTRTPVAAIERYWSHTRRASTADTAADLARLGAANLLALTPAGIEFHDLQHDYLLLHAPAMTTLHVRLLDAYRRLLRGRGQWWQLSPDEPYIWDRLVAHLRGAGARRELAVTIIDPPFVAHRIATGGVLVAERDLTDAAELLPADNVIAWWRSWLPQHTHLLDLPGNVADLSQRVQALAPTLRAWLAADPARPVDVQPDRLLAVLPDRFLDACWGLTPPSAAQTRVLAGHTHWVNAVAWSPDGAQLATAADDETVRIWDAATGRTIATLTGHTDAVRAVAWSPDGAQLATAGNDETVRIWDAATGRTVATLTGHTDWVNAVAWSPDGIHLATAADDKTVRIWDPATGHTATVIGRARGVNALAWSPDGAQLATAADDETVRIWDAATGRTIATLTGHTDAVRAVAWSPDGAQLATAGNDETVRIWDAATGRTGTVIGCSRGVNAVAWSPDGTHLATAGNDKTVRIWDATTGQTIATLIGHTRSVNAVAWSPDGGHLATSGADETVRIWSPVIAQARRWLRVHTVKASPVATLVDQIAPAWSISGGPLATYHFGTVSLWDPNTGSVTATIAGSSSVSAMAFAPDGGRLAILRSDAEVTVHTLDQSQNPCRLKLSSGSGVTWADKRIAVYGPAGVTMLRWTS
jgi:WD40 repeat protein